MGLQKITVWGYYCLRCGHRWVPRGIPLQPRTKKRREPDDPGKKPDEPEEPPQVCPSPLCKSPYWQTERRDA